jgi:hypothetical protein
MLKTLKTKLINRYLRHLFPIVDIERVMTTDKSGRVYLNGELVTGQKLATLKSEVQLLVNTELWEIISNTLKHQAQSIMFTNSKELMDVMNGKMVLYTIGVQEQIAKNIRDA